MTGDLFRGRTLAWLIGVSAVSLACALLLSIFGDDLAEPPPSAGPSTFSRSAIGHRAFLETLRRMQVPVVVSQGNSGAKAGASALLVVAEPQDSEESATALREMLAATETSLVVLPKWTGIARVDKPGWLSHVEPLSLASVEAVLGTATDGKAGPGSISRGGQCGVGGNTGSRASGTAEDVLERTAPTIADAQLLGDDDEIVPIMICPDGILLGAYEMDDDRTVYVLSDPDLLSTHGIGKGDNAALALAMIDVLRDHTRPLVIDESIHGYRNQPSLWRSLFEFPLVLATLQGLVALIALLLAATVRFGAPRPVAPAIGAGKDFLIENIASLLHFGGHAGHTLVRYLDGVVRDVATRLHAPADLEGAALRAWLERVAEARGIMPRLAELEAEVTAIAALPPRRQIAKVAIAAGRAHRWKQEMLRGAA